MKSKTGRPLKRPQLPYKIRELADKGLSNSEIARVLKIGRALVGYHLKKKEF